MCVTKSVTTQSPSGEIDWYSHKITTQIGLHIQNHNTDWPHHDEESTKVLGIHHFVDSTIADTSDTA